jgi:hypothetical protein
MSTTDDRAAARGIKVFDISLPQDWYDDATALSGVNPWCHVVWSYDHDSLFGFPAALTPEGDLIVALVELASPLMGEIHDDNRARLQERIGAAMKGVVALRIELGRRMVEAEA